MDVFSKILMETEGPLSRCKVLLINLFLPLACPAVGYCCCEV